MCGCLFTPSDVIWWYRYGSTLAQVMACCLTAPSHYLNQRSSQGAQYSTVNGQSWCTRTSSAFTSISGRSQKLGFNGVETGPTGLQSILGCSTPWLGGPLLLWCRESLLRPKILKVQIQNHLLLCQRDGEHSLASVVFKVLGSLWTRTNTSMG